jgi:hypothetical protein
MKLHVLPGDSLVEAFKSTGIEGETAVCRECLVDGDVKAENLNDFWRIRAKHLASVYPKQPVSYRANVRSELEKLPALNEGSEVNLWFEHELFCQVNMWFCLSLLKDTKARIFRVSPVIRVEEDIWKGFSRLPADGLRESFAAREEFGRADVRLGADLWNAFQTSNFNDLAELSKADSRCFPFLREVCGAAIEMETRPKAALKKIIERGELEFGKVFREFSQLEGIYGFGDLQVKRMYEELLQRSV